MVNCYDIYMGTPVTNLGPTAALIPRLTKHQTQKTQKTLAKA